MLISRLLAPMLALSLVLVGVLSYLLDFDLESSPGWQVGLHYLMLLLFLLGPFVLAVQRRFPRLGRFEWAMVCLVFLILAGVLVFGWLRGDSYTDFRDSHALPLGSIFVGASSIAICIAELSRAVVVISRTLARSRNGLANVDIEGA